MLRNLDKSLGSFRKNIQLMVEFGIGSTLFLLYINDPPDDVICKIAIFAILYSKCDRASDLSQQLELAYELESDPRKAVDWCKKWPVDFIAQKTHLVLLDRSNNFGAINLKMDGSFLEEKKSFRMLGLSFSSKFDWGFYITSVCDSSCL